MNIMQYSKAAVTAMVIGVFLASASGCQKQEGPAERAGKEVDKAADKVGQTIEKAGTSIQDAAKGDKK